jgi:hypothetical protein
MVVVVVTIIGTPSSIIKYISTIHPVPYSCTHVLL